MAVIDISLGEFNIWKFDKGPWARRVNMALVIKSAVEELLDLFQRNVLPCFFHATLLENCGFESALVMVSEDLAGMAYLLPLVSALYG